MRQQEKKLDTPKFRDFERGLKYSGLGIPRGQASSYERSYEDNFVRSWLIGCMVVSAVKGAVLFVKQLSGAIKHNDFDPDKEFSRKDRRRYGRRGKFGYRNNNGKPTTNNNESK